MTSGLVDEAGNFLYKLIGRGNVRSPGLFLHCMLNSRKVPANSFRHEKHHPIQVGELFPNRTDQQSRTRGYFPFAMLRLQNLRIGWSASTTGLRQGLRKGLLVISLIFFPLLGLSLMLHCAAKQSRSRVAD